MPQCGRLRWQLALGILDATSELVAGNEEFEVESSNPQVEVDVEE